MGPTSEPIVHVLFRCKYYGVVLRLECDGSHSTLAQAAAWEKLDASIFVRGDIYDVLAADCDSVLPCFERSPHEWPQSPLSLYVRSIPVCQDYLH